MSKKGRGRSLALETKYLPVDVKAFKTNEKRFFGVKLSVQGPGAFIYNERLSTD